MIKYLVGNILESKADALVNTVNTVGVMGKGIALQFKKYYPKNYKEYKKACDNRQLKIGQLLITTDHNVLSGTKTIINFPTKIHWRNPSKYEYIEKGVTELKSFLIDTNTKSVAIPPLGAGNGGLKWYKVKEILERNLIDIQDVDIYIYEPNNSVQEQIKKERISLTPARSLLLYVLFQLVKNGEFVTEFASEKICYFLQRFGAEEYLKLNFSQHYYGPYSGKVRHLLHHLNGSYIMGYESKDKKPFDYLSLIMDSEAEVIEYLKIHPELNKIAIKTAEFLDSSYSAFNLELLSSIDFLVKKNQTLEVEKLEELLKNWSQRKSTLYSNRKFIQISIDHLQSAELV